ncbi:hypothetical protein AVEN_138505-1 [Araneus ventricosus]|uniref:Uncharacterized protein n=1 Tax=Araneus ventricosus TaxID=182803 RepID=A0A4Y2PR96_ARAVE|nr:hypothetical protein AVEN_138505-1 [Araneus ventricosus]
MEKKATLASIADKLGFISDPKIGKSNLDLANNKPLFWVVHLQVLSTCTYQISLKDPLFKKGRLVKIIEGILSAASKKRCTDGGSFSFTTKGRAYFTYKNRRTYRPDR